jgi:glycosyltransferase involved in cell wall biosynthesis
MRRVVLCGTHTNQYNGYSKVMYELAIQLSKFDDIQLHIYGFQNFYNDSNHAKERELPANVEVYDAYLNEEPKQKGFGENNFASFIKERSPDIVIIYNDLVVISMLLKVLIEIPDRKFKIIPYIDLVYQNEKHSMIKAINDKSDGAIAFTEYWKNNLISQGFTKPLWTLEHGFNKQKYFPIPKIIARKYFEIQNDAFIILNLNRNQPRKRWDHCIMAYIKFISKHIGENIKLMILTAMTGGWDLVDIMLSEARKYGLTIEEIKTHFIFIDNPQKLTDYDINIMYNVANIGFNTCDGEGFGLCNFEQAAVGVPQIVPHVGGFIDFFNEDNSIPVKPILSTYCDNTKDGVGGEAQLCLIDDFVEALEKYYNDRQLITKHGNNARKYICENYDWKQKGEKLRDIIIETTKDLFPEIESQQPLDINQQDDYTDIDIDKMISDKLNNNNNTNVFDEKNIEDLPKDALVLLQRKIQSLLAGKDLN